MHRDSRNIVPVQVVEHVEDENNRHERYIQLSHHPLLTGLVGRIIELLFNNTALLLAHGLGLIVQGALLVVDRHVGNGTLNCRRKCSGVFTVQEANLYRYQSSWYSFPAQVYPIFCISRSLELREVKPEPKTPSPIRFVDLELQCLTHLVHGGRTPWQPPNR